MKRPTWTRRSFVHPIPDARPGMVFRYEYLRMEDAKKGIQHGKERPACILITLTPGERFPGATFVDEAGKKIQTAYETAEGDVLIVLIQSDPLKGSEVGIEIDIPTKRLVGLPTDKPSYAIVSEVNIDHWPNPAMRQIPGRPGEFTYRGLIPGPMLARIAKAWGIARERKHAIALVRTFP